MKNFIFFLVFFSLSYTSNSQIYFLVNAGFDSDLYHPIGSVSIIHQTDLLTPELQIEYKDGDVYAVLKYSYPLYKTKTSRLYLQPFYLDFNLATRKYATPVGLEYHLFGKYTYTILGSSWWKDGTLFYFKVGHRFKL